jgi:M6 family metalloprotease-like protein
MSFPFLDRRFVFTQPDGTHLEVRGWGDQHHAVFETLDGYTVVRDPLTGFYNYAALAPEADELRSTGIRVGRASPAALGLSKSTRITQEAGHAFAEVGSGLLKPRWRERHEEHRSNIRVAALAGTLAAAPALAPPFRQTVGTYVGLCLPIQFPDVAATVTQQEIDNFCNQTGYAGFGNNGSVYDYYFANSVGKLRYQTVVAPYYTARFGRSYYTNPDVQFGARARELIKEALTYHLSQGFDFSGLTPDSSGAVYATNIYYAGPVVNAWGQGLWPHSSRLAAAFPLALGRSAVDYQITNTGSSLELGTYCHENGHMLCDFPDLYNYANQRRGIGQYCLMCLGGNADPLNPHQIGAYLKFKAGWGNPAISLTSGQHVTLTAGQNQFVLHHKNDTEYFIIECRTKADRDATLSDAGLAIWHVDELGSNSEPQKAPLGHRHFECILVQADGRNDLGDGTNQGDTSDLLHAGGLDRFDDTTTPKSVWWDGSASGIKVHNISARGATMTLEG